METKSGDFLILFYFSLLKAETLQKHFIFELLSFKFRFWRIFGSKKRLMEASMYLGWVYYIYFPMRYKL
jgi:hypothetical protein